MSNISGLVSIVYEETMCHQNNVPANKHSGHISTDNNNIFLLVKPNTMNLGRFGENVPKSARFSQSAST